MVYTQLFNLLCDKADDVYGGKLPIHVRCLIDECANIGQIPNLEKLVATIRSREISACLVLQAKSQLKAIYKDNADTIIGNMDSQIFLGGSEPGTLKDLSEMLGKETIDAFNTSDTRGNSPSYGTNYSKLGHELLSRDELAVMDGGKCILQLRGVRPFLSDKYDLTQHPNYKLTSDFDEKNRFDIEKYLNRKAKIHPGDAFMDFQNLLKLEYGILVKDHRGQFSYLPADREKFISARTLGTSFDREHLLLLFQCNTAEKEKQQWRVDDSMDALYIKSNLRLVVNLQDCVKAQQNYAYTQKVKISNLQKMAQTVLYVQERGYDSYEKLYEAAESIDRKMATARSDAKLTEVKLKKVNEQIHHLGQYFSTKSVYSEFLKASNKKIFRQTYFDEIAKYEEARQFLKRDFQDEKFPSMKDLRAEKELLMRTKDARYETYRYFQERNAEIQTILANVDSIFETAKVQ